MIDLETLATTPDAAILTIGACLFDPRGTDIHKTFYQRIQLETQEKYNRVINEDTLAWWSKQDKQIQEDAFGEGNDRIDLTEAMKKLYTFGLGTSNVWSHGAIFDIVILEDVCKKLQQAVTWKFWEVRDTRTLFDLANVSINIEGKHNALNDAIAQSKAVQQSYAKLKL
jgi:exodeoxyribonuclease VIII